MGKKDPETGLTPQQELFCQAYASEEFFCNGVQSYIKAFDIDVSKKGQYDVAKNGAFRLLTKDYIVKRIDELIEDSGLNDQFVDKQLKKIITQDGDFRVKLGGISEYNKLKSRITKKVQVGVDEDLEGALGRLSNIIGD